MLLFLFFCSLSSFSMYIHAYNNLSSENWKTIKHILVHPKTPPYIQSKVRKIIYDKYENWAIHKAYEFNRLHKYKCRNIDVSDLILYSLEGLYRATLKYNGISYFHNYANIYISGSLYEGLTELQPITILPKSIRRQSHHDIKVEYNYQYKKLLNTRFVSYDEYWMFENMQKNIRNEKEEYFLFQEFWNQVNIHLDPFSKRVFHYKYNYFLDVIRSNKNIGEYMGCSEENIRINLIKSKKIIISQK